MTVYFNKARQRWAYHFEKSGKRYSGYCLDATGQPVTSRSAARQAEGVARRRVEMEPKVARPGELTMAMAIAALTPTWQLQAKWSARKIILRAIIGFFGADTAIGDIDQARTDDFVTEIRTRPMMAWKGGPLRDPADEANADYWVETGQRRAPATVNKYLDTLRQIFERAATHRDPSTGQQVFPNLPAVKGLRPPKRRGRPMPGQVSAEILSIMPAHVVDAMMVTACFGFRRTEAFTLDRNHIDWDNQGIRLRAEDVKDDEDIFLPADQFALGYLWCLDMEAERRATRHLITWRKGKSGRWAPIKNPKSAWKRARAFMNKKYGKAWRWHDLRAAFITNVAMKSGGIVAQTLARHSSFATTQGYIEVADQLRRQAARHISDDARALLENESRIQDPQTREFSAAPGKRTDLKLRIATKN